MKILLYISFVGTAYCGYQTQPNGDTIQKRLNEAAEALFGYPCDIVGCSRTDSGVHANMFCATVAKKGENHLLTTIPTDVLPRAFSSYLPEDISVFAAEEVADDFHPRYGVRYKEYVYRIWNHPIRNPFLRDRAWHCPKLIDDEALALMNEAAKGFIGKHDFASYMAAGSKVTDTVRTVLDAEVVRGEGSEIIFRAAVKPTPSVFAEQETINKSGENISINIKGRHDPVIVPRAVVVVECMAAITILDALLVNMSAKVENIKKFYGKL
jgi:tRNA pseudouridine38-40 synthase